MDFWCCPITHERMRDAVVADDGHTYERAAIEQWLRAHGTSPITRGAMASRTLRPNYALMAAMEQVLDRGVKPLEAPLPNNEVPALNEKAMVLAKARVTRFGTPRGPIEVTVLHTRMLYEFIAIYMDTTPEGRRTVVEATDRFDYIGLISKAAAEAHLAWCTDGGKRACLCKAIERSIHIGGWDRILPVFKTRWPWVPDAQ